MQIEYREFDFFAESSYFNQIFMLGKIVKHRQFVACTCYAAGYHTLMEFTRKIHMWIFE